MRDEGRGGRTRLSIIGRRNSFLKSHAVSLFNEEWEKINIYF
jgi:hypothetical protein